MPPQQLSLETCAAPLAPSSPVGTDLEFTMSPDETPNRKCIRAACLHGLEQQAARMKKQLSLPSGDEHLQIGTIVLLEAPDVDRTRVDPHRLFA